MTRLTIRRDGMHHPDSDLDRDADDVNDFIRRYDGDGNPIGIGKSDRHWAADLTVSGWRFTAQELYNFSAIFTRRLAGSPIFSPCPRTVGRHDDLFKLEKPLIT